MTAVWKERQVYLCEFKARLVYGLSSRIARDVRRTPVLKGKRLKVCVQELEEQRGFGFDVGGFHGV